MKILREKIFFDYEKYAKKYGEDASKRMRELRDTVAKGVREVRNLDPNNEYKSLTKTLRKKSEKALQNGKTQIAKLEGYEMGKKASEMARKVANRKIAGIALGVAVPTAVGTAYGIKKAIDKKKEDSDKNKESKKD